MRQTKKSISLQYALENLIAQGYQITDQTNFFNNLIQESSHTTGAWIWFSQFKLADKTHW